MLKQIDLRTEHGNNLLDITQWVKHVVAESNVEEGICVIFIPHTTAGIAINSSIDKNTLLDITDEINRIVPTRVDFHHQYDSPVDAAGHVKSVIVGNSLTLIISKAELVLGHSQSILFCEFDGPRNRRVLVRVMEDK